MWKQQLQALSWEIFNSDSALEQEVGLICLNKCSSFSLWFYDSYSMNRAVFYIRSLFI